VFATLTASSFGPVHARKMRVDRLALNAFFKVGHPEWLGSGAVDALPPHVSRSRQAAPGRGTDSIEELEKLVSGQGRLSQDRCQRAAFHHAVLRDDGHAAIRVPVHRMTALGPHMGEAD
jgi:hypothetical protein